MVQDIRRTAEFSRWLDALADPSARGRILVHIRRLSLGNPGDVRSVGAGISEIRIDWGPGYRIYLTRREGAVAILLCGGDKRTQRNDIALAKQLAEHL